MKIYISADIEGCTGISSFSQCGAATRDHFDYAFARKQMTQDLIAVIEGAASAGANEFVVKDGHGNCKNLLPDQLPGNVVLISGQGSTIDGMMDGIDESFDAAMLVGYHAMAGAPRAFMEHALVGGLKRFWINSVQAGEIMTNAAVAGGYGIPTVLVTSDEAGVREARATIPHAITVATKQALGYSMGALNAPNQNGPVLRDAAFKSVGALPSIPVFAIGGAVIMKAEFRTSEQADLPSLLSTVKRIDAYTLEWQAENYLSAHRVALNVFRLSIQSRATLS